MSNDALDVVGIGNAIVDVIARADDSDLTELGLAKGHMQLIDAADVDAIYGRMGATVAVSGGSAANTLAGIASLGGRAGFIGKVADDEFGHIFRHDLRTVGVSFDVPPFENGAPTARSLIFVTPDGERTMNTFLGISPELGGAEIDADLIGSAKVTYLEGYLFDRDAAQAAFFEACKIAQRAGRQVALTLSDGFCVDRHRDAFRKLVNDGIDLLFANEDEIKSLYETENFESALSQLKDDVRLAAVTCGEAGAIVVHRGEQTIVGTEAVSSVVDTTGAGDLFASGFLHGWTRDLPLDVCARMGNRCAGAIITQLGARPEASLKGLVADLV